MTVSIYDVYRKRLKHLATDNNSTIEELFDQGLEILFNKYEDILSGRKEKEIYLPIMVSTEETEKIQMTFNISDENVEKIATLVRRTGLKKSILANVAIFYILEELET